MLSGWLEDGLVGEDKDLKNEESNSDKAESEDFATLEGDLESLEDVNTAKVGGLDVALGGNSHANVSAKHGGESSNEEGDSGVRNWLSTVGPWHVDGTQDDDGESSESEGKSSVLFSQESNSTLK